MDEIDEVEDVFCQIISVISKNPRKKCDELFMQVNRGEIGFSEFENELRQTYGHPHVNKMPAIMSLYNEGS